MVRIGVVPARALAERPRLFAALALAFDAEFDAEGADGILAFEPVAPSGVPTLVIQDGVCRAPGRVLVHDLPALDPRLRGRSFGDRAAGGARVRPARGDTVLASVAGVPVWTLAGDGRTRRAAIAPDEIAGTESLRDQLVDGRVLGLLPVVELLRAAATDGWAPPPPRACFVLDDPNLHSMRYGHVDFAQLAHRAARGGYHVAVATVPIDQWYVNRRAADLFRDRRALSLAIHGSAHAAGELAVVRSADERRALLAHAVRQIESLERRGALRVSRVMVAPHERCSDEMIETFARSELEGLCFGWGERSAARPLADWEPLDLRGSGFPVLPRRPLGSGREELALRAYLDQPLILGLHHADLADGLGRLDAAAAELESIADVAWLPLDEIAARSIATRRRGSALHLRTYARRFAVDVPVGVDTLVVELPPSHPRPGDEVLLEGGLPRELGAPILVTGGETRHFALRRVDAFDLSSVTPARPGVRVVERRLAAETRDRLSSIRLFGRRSPA